MPPFFLFKNQSGSLNSPALLFMSMYHFLQTMLEKQQPTEVNASMMFWLNIHGFVAGDGTLRLT